MGGLEGNTKAEIVDKSGKPISGLFASGEVGTFSRLLILSSRP